MSKVVTIKHEMSIPLMVSNCFLQLIVQIILMHQEFDKFTLIKKKFLADRYMHFVPINTDRIQIKKSSNQVCLSSKIWRFSYLIGSKMLFFG